MKRVMMMALSVFVFCLAEVSSQAQEAKTPPVKNQPSDSTHRTQQREKSPAVEMIILQNRYDQLMALAETNSAALAIRNSRGFTAAHQAATIDSLRCLELIARLAPELLIAESDDGVTPAFMAAQYGHTKALKFILQQAPQALLARRGDGANIAHAAAVSDEPECICLLAAMKKALFTAQDVEGRTPAHLCVYFNNIAALIEVARLVPESLALTDSAGKTPRDMAADQQCSLCLQIIRGEPLTQEEQGGPSYSGWVKVKANSDVVRLFRRWTSIRIPEAKRGTLSGWNTRVSNTGPALWDIPPEKPPCRLMFFTSKNNPIHTLKEINPASKAGEFGVWDMAIRDHAFHFLARANMVSPEDRREYGIWLHGSQYLVNLFSESPKTRLFLTYSIYEDDIRKSGGVPVAFVTDENPRTP